MAKRIWTIDENATLAAMWANKARYNDMCETFHVSADVLRKHAREIGLPKRKSGRPTKYDEPMPRSRREYTNFVKRNEPERYARWALADKSSTRARQRKYYVEHREKCSERDRRYYQMHKAEISARRKERRARKVNNINEQTKQQ